jgi:hypothetical protein
MIRYRKMNAETIMAEVQELVSRSRAACLWFLKEDIFPETPSQALSILESIARHGDRETYVQARRLKEWLLLHSSEKSSL